MERLRYPGSGKRVWVALNCLWNLDQCLPITVCFLLHETIVYLNKQKRHDQTYRYRGKYHDQIVTLPAYRKRCILTSLIYLSLIVDFKTISNCCYSECHQDNVKSCVKIRRYISVSNKFLLLEESIGTKIRTFNKNKEKTNLIHNP